jgi:hypothetical protein
MRERRTENYLIQVKEVPAVSGEERRAMRDDSDYFLKRAEAQMALATRAACENAARAHYYLAGFYWDRAFNNPAAAQRDSGYAATSPLG